MKKAKILCLVMCVLFAFSVMLTACGDTATDPTPGPATPAPTDPTTTPDPDDDVDSDLPDGVAKPDRMDITKTFYFGDSTENMFYKTEFANWFTDQYGIRFVPHYPSRGNYIEVINLGAMSGDLIGLVQMFDVPSLMIWVNEGVVLSVDDLLADNTVWNENIPEWWKETYAQDGHVWALPNGTSNKPSWFARHIRGDWLDNVGLSVPDTIEELYEAVYAFTYDDPNQSGSNDTIGMTSRHQWLMGDIYQTFDARGNHGNAQVPNYNPNSELWEDSLLKPEMVEALTWVNGLYEEGLLDPELYTAGAATIRGRINNGYAGTVFDWVHNCNWYENTIKNTNPDAYIETIGALQGTTPANQYINFYEIRIGAPYALMRGTPQAKEVAHWYMNIFFGSPEGNYIGKYGVMGNMRGTGYFTMEDNVIYRNYMPAQGDGDPQAFPGPGIIDGHPDWEQDRVYELRVYSDDADFNEQRTELMKTQQERLIQIFDQYDATGRLWSMPPDLKEPSCALWLEQGLRGDQRASSNEAMSTAVTGTVPIDEALARYRQMAKSMGMQQVLDTANDNLGKVSTQTY